MRKYKRFTKVVFNEDTIIKDTKLFSKNAVVFKNEVAIIIGWDSIWKEYKVYLPRGNRIIVAKQRYIDKYTNLYTPLEVGDVVTFGNHPRNFKVLRIDKSKVLGNIITLSDGSKCSEYKTRRVSNYERYGDIKGLLSKIEDNL